MVLFGHRRFVIIGVIVLSKGERKHFKSFTSAGAEQVSSHCSRRSVESISGFYTNYYYSYTRGILCYFDKKCSVCLSYYLPDTTLADVDGKRGAGIRELAGLRSDMTEHGGLHGYKSRRETYDDRSGGRVLRS